MAKLSMTLLNSRSKGLASHNDRTAKGVCPLYPDKTSLNLYYQWNGTGHKDFKEAEIAFYRRCYSADLERKNTNYKKQRHYENVRTIEQVYYGQKTKPMESWFQFGNRDGSCDAITLRKIWNTFAKRMHDAGYLDNYHVLDLAMHLDEATPHIQIRSIIDYTDGYGNRVINQNKGLEAMGFDRPNADAKESRTNNRLVSWTKWQRDTLQEIAQEYGIEVIEVGDGHGHKDKEQFIAEQEERERLDKLIDELADEYNRLADNYNTLIEDRKALKDSNITKARQIVQSLNIAK